MFWRPTQVWPKLEDLQHDISLLTTHGVTATFGLLPTSSAHARYVAQLAGGRVAGDARMVSTAKGACIGGVQFLFGAADPANHSLTRKRRPYLPSRLHGTSLMLTASNGDNYFHWLFDSLPRLRLAELAGVPVAKIDHFLLNRKSGVFQRDTLRMLGIDLNKVHLCSKYGMLKCDTLVLPSMPTTLGEPEAWVCDFLRQSFWPSGGLPKPERRIYISRAKAQGRKMVNEDELVPLLTRHGFEVLYTEGMSFAEQVALFSSAESIIAPHGAGLSNIVFAQPGCRVMELGIREHHNEVYRLVAQHSGLRYTHAFLELAQKDPGQREDRFVNMRVSPGDFEQLLERLAKS